MSVRTPPPIITGWLVGMLVTFIVVLAFIGGMHPAGAR